VTKSVFEILKIIILIAVVAPEKILFKKITFFINLRNNLKIFQFSSKSFSTLGIGYILIYILF